ncbi:MAG TPA: hypothetical protein VJC17_02465 [Candidatus Dojkabacteria bacterium]|nr:hypothetical protein [Candidatus Dojkabacteria bacterium]
MKRKLTILVTVVPVFLGAPLVFIVKAYAHCPLCVIGAGLAATGATFLGVKDIVVGIFIGAFGVSLGLWLSRLITRQFIPRQRLILTAIIFITTILPVMQFMDRYTSIYISWGGDYGSIFNTTYIFNLYFIGTLLGAFIMLVTPFLSKKLSRLRKGKLIPYQGLLITFSLLFISGLFFQFVI